MQRAPKVCSRLTNCTGDIALESERLAIGEKTKELEALTAQLVKQKDQIMQLESTYQGVLREIASIKESESMYRQPNHASS
jgi:hypothetical protein